MFLGYATSLAQNVSIQATLDRAEMRTGEQASIDVVMRTDNLPETKFYIAEDARKGEPFVVVRFTPIDTIDIAGSTLKEIKAQLVITSFDSTLITIPPIIIETPSRQAETKPLALNIIQPEVDAAHPENFKPVKAPQAYPLLLSDILEAILTSYIYWGILFLLLVAYLVLRYQLRTRHRQSAPSLIPSAPQLSALDIALGELARLEQHRLENQADYKAYYTSLVDTIKAYILQRRGLEVLEKTSGELLTLLEGEVQSAELLHILRSLLLEADMSKFAKNIPAEGDARASLHQARLFLRHIEEHWTLREQTSNQPNTSSTTAS